MINGITGQSGYGLYLSSDLGTSAVDADKRAEQTGLGTDKTAAASECQTCKNRTYQDGSNENVSFKSPTRIAPEAAASAVRSHESEHVSNAYAKAAQNDGKVVSASVAIHTSICPECGRPYVSGGTTSTTIKYSNEENPYVKSLKAQQGEALKGQFIDAAA